jgi:hypothetical protein
VRDDLHDYCQFSLYLARRGVADLRRATCWPGFSPVWAFI